LISGCACGAGALAMFLTLKDKSGMQIRPFSAPPSGRLFQTA
jgi:hypothetical protein